MRYHCNACSYSGRTSGPAGECPACGSYALVRRSQQEADSPAPARWRLVLLVCLWGYLIALVIWKLLR